MTNLMLLQREHIASWQPKIFHHLEDIAVTMRGKYDADDLFSCAVRGLMQIWLGLDGEHVQALGLTQLNVFPSTKICQFIAMIGHDRHDWQPFIKAVEAWAYADGCTDMELIARPGWERVMKNFDYEKTHVVLNKHLGGNHGR